MCTCTGEINAAIPSSGSVDQALDEIHNSYEMNKNDHKSQFYKKKREVKQKKLYELYDKKNQEEIQYKKICRLASLPLRNLLGR